MILENLFDRDLVSEAGMADPGTDVAAQLALAGTEGTGASPWRG